MIPFVMIPLGEVPRLHVKSQMVHRSPEQSETQKKVSDWSAGLLTDVTSCRFAMEKFCGIVTSCPVRTTTKGAETSALRLSTLVFAILIATIYETMHDDYRRESVLYYGKKLPESRAPQK